MRFHMDIHAPQRLNCYNFGGPTIQFVQYFCLWPHTNKTDATKQFGSMLHVKGTLWKFANKSAERSSAEAQINPLYASSQHQSSDS